MNELTATNGAGPEGGNAAAWRLALRVAGDRVLLAAYSDVEQDSLLCREILLDGGEEERLRVLENCVYDNQLLLQDYKRVTIALTSRQFMLVPAAMSDEAARAAHAALYGDRAGDTVVDEAPGAGVKIVYGLQPGLLRFIERTFDRPTVHHHLWAVIEHFAARSKGASVSREMVYLHEGWADVCVTVNGAFAFANSYSCPVADDAAYYALNAWRQLGLDPEGDEMQLIGDRQVRDAIAPVLRNYVKYVMPAIFPAASMRMGHDAVKAPFDLILLLLLCE